MYKYNEFSECVRAHSKKNVFLQISLIIIYTNKRMELKYIIEQFQTEGTIIDFSPYGTGHINDTYKVVTGEKSSSNYLLQRINHNVFKDVPGLMENIQRVTTHIRKKLSEIPGSNPDRETLSLIETVDGKTFYLDDTGNYYRMYLFIEDHNTYDIVKTAHQAYEAGRMFGKFQNFLSDLPGKPLNETIRDFHNIEFRLNELFSALAADKEKRSANVSNEIKFVENRMDEMKILLDLSRKGEIPTRVTHNDTKFNNVLLDKNDNGLCVIDLDTVMPGIIHYDFGDSIRTATNTGAEDEVNLEKVKMDIDLFEGYTRGYLKEMVSLTNRELEYLPLAAKLLPYIIGIRFLTDYLKGDHYFKIKHREHNLQRAKTQFKLLNSMEKQYEKMIDIVSSISNDYV